MLPEHVFFPGCCGRRRRHGRERRGDALDKGRAVVELRLGRGRVEGISRRARDLVVARRDGRRVQHAPLDGVADEAGERIARAAAFDFRRREVSVLAVRGRVAEAAGEVLEDEHGRALLLARVRERFRCRAKDVGPIRAVTAKNLAAAQALLNEFGEPAVARQRDRRVIVGDAEDDRHAGAAVGAIFGKINRAQKVGVVHAAVAHGHVLDATLTSSPRLEGVGERAADGARRLARERRRDEPIIMTAADTTMDPTTGRVRARDDVAPRPGQEQVFERVAASERAHDVRGEVPVVQGRAVAVFEHESDGAQQLFAAGTDRVEALAAVSRDPRLDV
mmetsp:Transcript_10922/g.29825  ORF Transcript_10922/g.29825 Transcript_10922/m.29825 type:complete len:334 (-) Transcript_10922:785-1786(-)